MSKTYVITGGSGNNGKVLADYLLSAKQKVRVITREASKVKSLKGAEVHVGDLHDESFLNNAFSGADAAFLMIPPPMNAPNVLRHSHSIINHYLAAVKANNIKHVVLLSTVGAHDLKTKSAIEGLKDMEQAFQKLNGVNVLVLRPTYYMENFFFLIPVIKQMGIAGSAVRGDLVMPMVATKDVAAVAAKRLLELSFTGKSHEYILGEHDLSHNEATKILGAAIGKPDLQYVTFSYEQAEQAMARTMSADYAHRLVQMAKDMNEGEMLSDVKRTKENTSPTSIEEFSQGFAEAFKTRGVAES